MFYVYILYSLKDKGIYIGCPSSIIVRYKEHCKGMVASTKTRRPLILIYFEAYLFREDAYKREKYLKTGWGKYYL